VLVKRVRFVEHLGLVLVVLLDQRRVEPAGELR
jgi:hypothetical protein